MRHNKTQNRERIINLLSDGQWKTAKELGTNFPVLSEMVRNNILESRLPKMRRRYTFGKHKQYRLKQ